MATDDSKDITLRQPPVEISVPPAVHSRPAGYEQDLFDEGDQQSSFHEYLRIINRRKGTIILVAVLGLLAGVLITLPQTPVYQARTTIEIQEMNENFLNMKQVTPVSEGGIYATLADIQTQIKILQSSTLLERVVEKLKVKGPADLKMETGRISAWRRALNLPDVPEKDAREEALKMAAAGVRVKAAGQTRIIEVTVDSTDPNMAAAFANTLANEFIDQNMESRWQMTQRTGDWLARQLDEMKIKLEKSEDALQEYARKAGLLFTGEKQNVSEEKLRQLQSALSAAQMDRVAKQARYEMAKNSSPETLPDVLNDPTLQDYQSKITELRRQEAELSATYKPEYSRVKKVQAQLATVEAALKRERAAIINRIKNEYDEALQRERMLARDYAAQTRVVTAEAEKSIQYNILKREVETNRQLYEAMLQRVKESSILSALRASNVRVVDPAKPPTSPYKPDIPLSAGVGLLAGSLLGVAFVVVRERADRTLQEPGDAPFYLNVPELGVIPAADTGRHLLYYKRRKLPAEAKSLVKAESRALPDRVELATWQQKPSLVAESFRVVLTSILFSGANGNQPRVLVLTSAAPGEGKTTVASNLAIAISEIRLKVLVIDGDMRKPRLHTVFDVDNQRGLSTLLSERPLAESALEGVIQQSSIPGLFVLPSGPETPAAANLLHSANLAELLARFRKEFDMIVIDTPPMLQMPDARVIGRLADGVILVARAGVTTRDAALAARQRFAEDRIRVLGTILNYWSPKHAPGGYYGYRSYAGYYSSKS
jgi:succinoglycan biosynthesis transport protein ExoP